jgi:hypothetical protein
MCRVLPKVLQRNLNYSYLLSLACHQQVLQSAILAT